MCDCVCVGVIAWVKVGVWGCDCVGEDGTVWVGGLDSTCVCMSVWVWVWV